MKTIRRLGLQEPAVLCMIVFKGESRQRIYSILLLTLRVHTIAGQADHRQKRPKKIGGHPLYNNEEWKNYSVGRFLLIVSVLLRALIIGRGPDSSNIVLWALSCWSYQKLGHNDDIGVDEFLCFGGVNPKINSVDLFQKK
jgi:hypothetical protein